jgi:hypothetical protein
VPTRAIVVKLAPVGASFTTLDTFTLLGEAYGILLDPQTQGY